jgi:hypothetical protein
MKRNRGEKDLFKILARIVLSSTISKKLGEFKQLLTLKKKFRNYAPI